MLVRNREEQMYSLTPMRNSTCSLFGSVNCCMVALMCLLSKMLPPPASEKDAQYLCVFLGKVLEVQLITQRSWS